MVHNFLDIRLFVSLFLADSRGEEQEDGLLGQMKAFTLCLYVA